MVHVVGLPTVGTQFSPQPTTVIEFEAQLQDMPAKPTVVNTGTQTAPSVDSGASMSTSPLRAKLHVDVPNAEHSYAASLQTYEALHQLQRDRDRSLSSAGSWLGPVESPLHFSPGSVGLGGYFQSPTGSPSQSPHESASYGFRPTVGPGSPDPISPIFDQRRHAQNVQKDNLGGNQLKKDNFDSPGRSGRRVRGCDSRPLRQQDRQDSRSVRFSDSDAEESAQRHVFRPGSTSQKPCISPSASPTGLSNALTLGIPSRSQQLSTLTPSLEGVPSKPRLPKLQSSSFSDSQHTTPESTPLSSQNDGTASGLFGQALVAANQAARLRAAAGANPLQPRPWTPGQDAMAWKASFSDESSA